MIQSRPDYDEQLDQDVAEAPEKPRFTVTDLRSASWALERLSRHQRAMAEADAVAAERIDDIRQWLAREAVKHQGAIRHLESLLEDYARKRAAEDPKVRTISLPEGNLELRRQQPDYHRDDAALLDYVKESGLPFVETTERLKWAELKAATTLREDGAVVLTETGERLPGVIGQARGDFFRVRLKEA